jgi:ATP-dependent Clp protease adapter protein ClpS
VPKASWWIRGLRRLGIEVHELDQPQVLDPNAVAAGRYVFVENDRVSPMDRVATWLERTFSLPQKEAALIMMRIHRAGWHAVGPFEPLEAERRIEAGRRHAAELGLTQLRFSREPPVSWAPINP